MGLFDNLFMAVDLVKSGIASYKAESKLEELAQQSQDDYDDVLTDESRALYAEYKKLKDQKDAMEPTEEITEEQQKLDEQLMQAVVDYLLSLTGIASLPKSFRNQIPEAIAEWQRTNDLPMEIMEKRMMKVAKTDEEREVVRQILDEAKKEMDEEEAATQ